MIGKWRKLHKDKLHYSYFSTNIIRITKAWRIRLAGHVVHLRGKRNAYRIFIGKPERYHSEDLGIDARIILTRKLMQYVQHNIEVRSCNHCCRGKAISITYFECVSVALGIIYHLLSFRGSLQDYKIHMDMEIVNTVYNSKGIEHTMGMCHIVICDLSGSTIFIHIIS